MYHSDPQMLLLLYFVLPVWLIAGFADWLCHRATDIETTTGLKETYIHILMFLEMGLPLLAALFLDVNSLVIAFMIVLFFCHEATALWDVSYAVTARRVSPIEQHIHSFLEMVPLMALLLVISRHWPQFLALFGFGDEPARFELKQRDDPLPAGYITAVLSGIFFLEVLPYLEEYWRGKKASKGGSRRG
ncbi:diguanylate cyclase [Erwinia sp. MMLR14_017]|uniref:diguanylate cyclase n=1 Tax=Erwinia sp. MMLR14_017 TaxID=3093842 RepID=UPI0029902803|nr:diguanylate cyclase [Erwinia sp. MMLR14_017]MDW8845983.1 diguanylate cyclase [Erwinia sp. MMLR14_017]